MLRGLRKRKRNFTSEVGERKLLPSIAKRGLPNRRQQFEGEKKNISLCPRGVVTSGESGEVVLVEKEKKGGKGGEDFY